MASPVHGVDHYPKLVAALADVLAIPAKDYDITMPPQHGSIEDPKVYERGVVMRDFAQI
jgi:hypothetical protein